MSLPTLLSSVQKLQTALQAKAKAEPSYRFYSLWDKVCREDVLWEAYQHCRRNDGAPGADRVAFQQIKAAGVEHGWRSCRRSYGARPIARGPFFACGYPRAMVGNARSRFPRSVIAWRRWRCCW